jgi:hypothetical protein
LHHRTFTQREERTVTLSSEFVGVEIVRYPITFPKKGTTGKPQYHKLTVKSLSVVLGACLVPPPYTEAGLALARKRKTTVPGLLTDYKLHVAVDDHDIIDGERASRCLGVVGQRLVYRSKASDPLVVLPRDGGVEVVIGFECERNHPGVPRADAWDLWLYVGR